MTTRAAVMLTASSVSVSPAKEPVKYLQPHPEEAALLGGRLEGWMHGTRSRACPTSARRSPKSATADFGCSLPSFETRRKRCGAPQDEVANVLLRFAHPTHSRSQREHVQHGGRRHVLDLRRQSVDVDVLARAREHRHILFSVHRIG